MSYQFTVDPRRRAIGRIVQDIRNELRRAYAERHEIDGLTQADLARIIGVDRSAVHRMLAGQANLTARSIASLVVAMDKGLTFRIVDLDEGEEPGRNELQVTHTEGSHFSNLATESQAEQGIEVLVPAG